MNYSPTNVADDICICHEEVPDVQLWVEIVQFFFAYFNSRVVGSTECHHAFF